MHVGHSAEFGLYYLPATYRHCRSVIHIEAITTSKRGLFGLISGDHGGFLKCCVQQGHRWALSVVILRGTGPFSEKCKLRPPCKYLICQNYLQDTYHHTHQLGPKKKKSPTVDGDMSSSVPRFISRERE